MLFWVWCKSLILDLERKLRGAMSKIGCLIYFLKVGDFFKISGKLFNFCLTPIFMLAHVLFISIKTELCTFQDSVCTFSQFRPTPFYSFSRPFFKIKRSSDFSHDQPQTLYQRSRSLFYQRHTPTLHSPTPFKLSNPSITKIIIYNSL